MSCAATSAAISRADRPGGEKRAGWRRHGILVVAEQDPRLTWPERELVRQLGVKLYGERSEGGR